ncbi:hypothetical protein J1614_009005 [Plenodomus biglobosus]|nr:hypothetical protein J1614_009005 [Plenodomus biglobosus]
MPKQAGDSGAMGRGSVGVPLQQRVVGREQAVYPAAGGSSDAAGGVVGVGVGVMSSKLGG